MNGIIYGILAMLGFGLGNALGKIPLKELNPIQMIFFRNIFTSLFLLAGILILNFPINFDLKYIIISVLIGIFGYIPLLLFYKSVGTGKIGVVVPVANSSFIFTVIFSVYIFGEKLALNHILSIIIILTGIVLSSISFKDWKNSDILKLSSGIPTALITCFGWGLFFFLSKYPINIIGPILTGLIMEFVIMISAFLHLTIAKNKLFLPSKKNLFVIFLIGLLGSIGALSFNVGISKYNVSIISTIASSGPIISVLFSRFVYKENLKFIQYFAVGIILIGLILISL